jgi:hypothetical protein
MSRFSTPLEATTKACQFERSQVCSSVVENSVVDVRSSVVENSVVENRDDGKWTMEDER